MRKFKTGFILLILSLLTSCGNEYFIGEVYNACGVEIVFDLEWDTINVYVSKEVDTTHLTIWEVLSSGNETKLVEHFYKADFLGYNFIDSSSDTVDGLDYGQFHIKITKWVNYPWDWKTCYDDTVSIQPNYETEER